MGPSVNLKPSASLKSLSPAGKHPGTIIGPKHVHNMAWGDEEGQTLYLCGRSGLYRMHLNNAGIRP